MSYEDLEEHNVFLPEDVWGKADLTTTVNRPVLVMVFVLGIGGCLLMWWGHGSFLTWIGAIMYILFMYSFMYVSNAGIERQNEEITRLEQQHND